MRTLIPGFALAAVLSGVVTLHSQATADLFFSEYVEGTSNNKALEIYNPTGSTVDLSTEGYAVDVYFNGATTAGLAIPLTGTLAPSDVFVLAHASAVAEILDQADQTITAGWYNGDDAIVLRRGTVVLDVIGQIGHDPGAEWGTGFASTADNTLQRALRVCAGDGSGGDAFLPAAEWVGFAVDTFAGLGYHYCDSTEYGPWVDAAEPPGGTPDFPLDGTLSVTFSEPVDVAANAFSLTCSTSGAVALTLGGGPTQFTLDPVADLRPGESCTFTVHAAGVSDQDADDPPDRMDSDVEIGFTTASVDACALPITPIYAIQGSGTVAAVTGTVTTQGVVVGDYEGPSPALRGFFLQDPVGDGDPATSDGIFVFDGTDANRVALGDVVRITGTVVEFQGQTQVSLTASTLLNCGTGTVTPTDVTLPMASADAFERFEGMLVRLPQTLTVTEHFQLGRFGQVVLSSNGRLAQPTSVTTPGAAALALQAQNDRNRLILDDASQAQNVDPIVFARGGLPLSASNTLRGGDTASGIVGVMTWTWGGAAASPNAWRVRPVGALGGRVSFQPTNARPADVPDVGGTLRVAGMNLLNYFNTFVGCTNGVGGTAADCRGADDAFEFSRQWPKTVQAILRTNADVVGVVELENDGYDAASAIADLVDRLNAATSAGTFAFLDVDARTGQVNALGTDGIKVGLIYRPARVAPVGETAVLNTTSFITGGDTVARNRPSLAQAFQTPAGGRFVAVVNHLKSKGSACDVPDAGDGQGNCNAVRRAAATELAAWLGGDPTGTGEDRILVLGDLNAYAQEDPVSALRAAGFTNLTEDLNGPSSYSYAFDGQWGYLDHALASPALRSQVTGVAEYHVNADEPTVLDYNVNFKSAGHIVSLYAPDEFRAADHDPIVVGLDLRAGGAGYVTGAGWLDVPITDVRRRTRGGWGKVAFALTVINKGDGRAPWGGVLVRFERDGVFTSTGIDWLTVVGNRATLQGRGAIGRDKRYAFRIEAVDDAARRIDDHRSGDHDQMRVVIWNVSTGATVFDSGQAEVRGGSLVVREITRH